MEDDSSLSAMQQPIGIVQQLTFRQSRLVFPPPSIQPSWGHPGFPVQWHSTHIAGTLCHRECCTLACLSDPLVRPQALSTQPVETILSAVGVLMLHLCQVAGLLLICCGFPSAASPSASSHSHQHCVSCQACHSHSCLPVSCRHDRAARWDSSCASCSPAHQIPTSFCHLDRCATSLESSGFRRKSGGACMEGNSKRHSSSRRTGDRHDGVSSSQTSRGEDLLVTRFASSWVDVSTSQPTLFRIF